MQPHRTQFSQISNRLLINSAIANLEAAAHITLAPVVQQVSPTVKQSPTCQTYGTGTYAFLVVNSTSRPPETSLTSPVLFPPRRRLRQCQQVRDLTRGRGRVKRGKHGSLSSA